MGASLELLDVDAYPRDRFKGAEKDRGDESRGGAFSDSLMFRWVWVLLSYAAPLIDAGGERCVDR